VRESRQSARNPDEIRQTLQVGRQPAPSTQSYGRAQNR
jgi:hypothetical protein